MTIEGAIAQLQELIDNDEIPFWAKPSLQKVMETIEMEREQNIDKRKAYKWIVWQDCEGKTRTFTCPICGNEKRSWRASNYCENCGERMEVDE